MSRQWFCRPIWQKRQRPQGQLGLIMMRSHARTDLLDQARHLVAQHHRLGDTHGADLVGAAVFLASDAYNFVNGHILYVDGGVTATL
jgi:NAD(P)-dependent dehydrogenase (short-subunit alcohol dehydrogenase family)